MAKDKNIEGYSKMKKEELITSLKMEPPIVAFLTKMTSGQATIEDLDETMRKNYFDFISFFDEQKQ